MKKLMIFLIASIPFLLIMVVQLTSVVIQETQYVSVEKVFFEQEQVVVKKETYQDVTLQFPAKINPIGATHKNVVYSSSDTSIAEVDSLGNVTFKDFGYVTIYAQSLDNKALVAKCMFHVTDNKAHRVEIVERIETMVVNTTFFVRANIVPVEAIDKSLQYESSNPQVAEIMPDGMIKALSGGQTTISVKTANGCTDSFVLNVIVPVSGVFVSETSIVTAETALSFPSYEVQPTNATNKNVRFESSNESVATIDSNGNITFSSAGTVEFSVITTDGSHVAKCEVTSTGGYIIYGNLLTTSINVDYEQNKQLLVETEIYPLNANKKNVYYVSNNENVVKVDSNGNLIVVGGRSATVDVYIKTSATTSNKIGTVNVFVNRPIEDISINNGLQVETNLREYQINYSVTPANDYTDNVTFSIQSNVATVSQTGLVEFNAPGNAVVTLTTDGGVTKSVKITFTPAGAKTILVDAANFDATVSYLDSVFAIVFDNGLDMLNVTFNIENPNIVEYNTDSQTFFILKGGNTKIMAVASNGNVATINLTVLRNATSLNAVVEGFNNQTNILTAAQTLKINYSVLPLDATNLNVEFSLNNGAKASISENGLITFANQAEQIVVTVTALGGTGLNKTFNINYTNGLPTEFALIDSKIEIEEIGTTYNINELLFENFLPSNYVFNLEHFTFESLNKNVVTISNSGVITAVGGGTTSVKIGIGGTNFTKVISVEVIINCTGVDFTYNNAVFSGGKIIGNSFQLNALVYPSNATNKEVSYEIVSGSAATISSGGLVEFNSAGQVVVKVKTSNNKENSITLEKVGSPTQLQLLKENINIENSVVNIKLNDMGNVVFKLNASGVIDLQNIDYSKISTTINAEDGLTLNIVNNGGGYFTVTKTIGVQKSVKADITFKYGETSVKTTIKYCQLTNIQMVLDSTSAYGNETYKVTLNNADDNKYGLERKRVFGTSSYYNSQQTNKLILNTIKNDEAKLDDVYWFSGNSQIAYFENVLNGELTFNTSNVTSEIKLLVYACSEPDLTNENAIIASYEFTLVPNSINVFTAEGYKYGTEQYIDTVLQVNLGSQQDETELKQNTPTAPFSAFDPVIHASSNLQQSHVRSRVYGNGYFVNYHGYSSRWNGQIVLFGDVNNLTLKCQNFDSTKETYVNEAAASAVTLNYVTIQNAKRGLYISKRGTLLNTTLKNCIIKHVLEYGILSSDYTDTTLFMENTMIYDCGQTAINFQKGILKIKGLFNVINFRAPSEFDGFGYKDILQKAYSSSEFNEYVDKSAGSSANYKINLAIVATPSNLIGSPDSTASSVYFWDSSKNDYVANVDNCTGLGYNKLTYTNGWLLKTTIYVWTTKLSSMPVNTTIDESVIYRQV